MVMNLCGRHSADRNGRRGLVPEPATPAISTRLPRPDGLDEMHCAAAVIDMGHPVDPTEAGHVQISASSPRSSSPATQPAGRPQWRAPPTTCSMYLGSGV